MRKMRLIRWAILPAVLISILPALGYANHCVLPEREHIILEAKDIDVLGKNRSYLKGLASRHGPDHLKYADALVNHAQICWRAGLYRESEDSYKKAIKIYKQKLGKRHRRTQTAKSDLAKLYKKFGCTH